jgi:hypothetical protein
MFVFKDVVFYVYHGGGERREDHCPSFTRAGAMGKRGVRERIAVTARGSPPFPPGSEF